MIVVIGQPRTGTSLAMQMLHAAGADCIGPWPSFEVPFETWSADDFAQCSDNTAAKYVWPSAPAKVFPRGTRFIVTSRNANTQVESERKFLRFFIGGLVPTAMTRVEKRARRKMYHDKQKKIRHLVGDRPHVSLPFEVVIGDPVHTSRLVCAIVGSGDPKEVAGVVVPRDPGNYPGLLETALIK